MAAVSGKTTLFVGDLAIFCKEEDMLRTFSPFGDIADVKIMKSEETNRNLSYGFVKFLNPASAKEAMAKLDGRILCGRPLRIRWASYKNKLMHRETRVDGQDNSPVHVSFISYQTETLVTEESLRQLFSRFGFVVDVSIKKSMIDPDVHRQSGYGFVYYSFQQDGIASALEAVRCLSDTTLEDVNYKCSLSHNLMRHLNPDLSAEMEALSLDVGNYDHHAHGQSSPATSLASQPSPAASGPSATSGSLQQASMHSQPNPQAGGYAGQPSPALLRALHGPSGGSASPQAPAQTQQPPHHQHQHQHQYHQQHQQHPASQQTPQQHQGQQGQQPPPPPPPHQQPQQVHDGYGMHYGPPPQGRSGPGEGHLPPDTGVFLVNGAGMGLYPQPVLHSSPAMAYSPFVQPMAPPPPNMMYHHMSSLPPQGMMRDPIFAPMPGSPAGPYRAYSSPGQSHAQMGRPMATPMGMVPGMYMSVPPPHQSPALGSQSSDPQREEQLSYVNYLISPVPSYYPQVNAMMPPSPMLAHAYPAGGFAGGPHDNSLVYGRHGPNRTSSNSSGSPMSYDVSPATGHGQLAGHGHSHGHSHDHGPQGAPARARGARNATNRLRQALSTTEAAPAPSDVAN